MKYEHVSGLADTCSMISECQAAQLIIVLEILIDPVLLYLKICYNNVVRFQQS